MTWATYVLIVKYRGKFVAGWFSRPPKYTEDVASYAGALRRAHRDNSGRVLSS